MPDIIHLLPDSVANQIAAGEVIQRPASVIKELMENAVDAGSSSIKVIIKDAGKSLVQIIDNGCGMSETDARMSFERHATSKIQHTNDLFAIRTLGFRGEALASIAAIAQVELKTRLTGKEMGTQININGSEITGQEPVSCPNGSNFAIKNLFFNVPVRRKFLKSNTTELKHIISEFHRVVLTNPEISFSLYHNNTEIYTLPATSKIQRIMNIFGRNINQYIIPIATETSIIKIEGFIGKPEFARKTFGEQYFFVNKRFIKHPFFHKAVMQAYEQILPPDAVPSYFLFFKVDPSSIDINIHPTKTEVKFEDERSIWQIIQAAVKQTLGKFNIVPSIDFNTEGAIDIPVKSNKNSFNAPSIEINPDFNPFGEGKKDNSRKEGWAHSESPLEKNNLANWQDLYPGFETRPSFRQDTERRNEVQMKLENDNSSLNDKFFQLKNKYILTPVKSGLMVIDQKRAHERILFERFSRSLQTNKGIAQQTLFPSTMQLNAEDHTLLMGMLDDICSLGFDIRDFGKHSIVINGCPSDACYSDPSEMIEVLLEEYKNNYAEVKTSKKEKVAQSLAKASSVGYGKKLEKEEMRELFDKLFACEAPNYSPDGRPIILIIATDDIDKKFK